MQTDTTTVRGDDGHALFVYAWRPDDGAPVRGVLHLVHGMAEHAARYERLGIALAEHGWAMYAHDQRGHGRTATRDEDLGYFEGGWQRLVDDVATLSKREREAHPGAPFVLMGHSMGSFVVQQAIEERPEGIAAVVLSGSNGRPGLLAQAGRLASRFERMRLGARGKSAPLDALSFGSFNKPFEPARTKFEWLSRDPAEVDKYVADPRCGFLSATSVWVELTDTLVQIARRENVARVPKDLPIYVFSGERDPVGEMSAGVKRLAEAYRAAGVKNVTLKLYANARHEMLNETNRDEVIADLLAWLGANTSRAQ